MFGKLFKKQPDQSQSMSGINANGSVVQQAQAGRDLQQVQSGNLDTEQQITQTEVVKQLENLETAVNASAFSQAQKDELLDYLRPAKRETTKENANKDLIGQNLKSFNDTLKTVKETTETSKTLWTTAQEVFKTVGPWLGVAAHFWGL